MKRTFYASVDRGTIVTAGAEIVVPTGNESSGGRGYTMYEPFVLFGQMHVVNLTGHEMPTGYPSRRAWLHVAVHDADAAAVERHYDEIRRDDEVQIYESVMADTKGAVTTALLQATRYVKDNRLLPRGFDKATAQADVAVRGSALEDRTFTGGGDRVRYVVPLEPARGPFAIDVELRYQPIGFRWAQNLVRYDSPEPRRFVAYFDSMARSSSVVIARTSSSVR
jgi:hypothetical protein